MQIFPDMNLLKVLVKNNKCKNKTPGLLLINSNFTFHFNKWSPNKEIAYYTYASRRTGACTATAIVTKLTSDSTQVSQIVSLL